MGTTATTRSADQGATKTAFWQVSRLILGTRRAYLRDLAVAGGFLALAVWLGHGLWPDPATRVLSLNPEDQILIEWFLAVDTRVLLLEHGLITDRLNVPDGMNLVANATSLTLGFLLAPVTLTLGAPVSFAILTIGNLAGTAIAWYLLFARALGAHRAVAAVGGGFCGFAPAMVSQSNSHWHMTAQWLVPVIVWCVVRLARAAESADDRRVVTSGLLLAIVVTIQYFLGAEVLYLTAVALLLLTPPYALARRGWVRRIANRFLAGMFIATGVGVLLLAYPLWMQFAGPGSVSDGPFSPHFYSADLVSWVVYSPLSVAGTESAAALATGPAEYNTFLGAPLLLAVAGVAVWLRRSPLALAAAVAGLALAVLSLGPRLIVNETPTALILPYLLLVDKPVIDGALPQRYAMAVVPLIAVLLVLALERARRLTGPVRRLVPVTAGLVLLPLLPTPLPTQDRPPVPEFIAGGHWRECVDPGGVLVPVPLPTPSRPEPMRWAAASNAEFALPEGFFIGPYGTGGTASMGIYPLPTSRMLAEVSQTGQAPQITDQDRERAQHDLSHWRSQCVVLGPDQPHQEPLRTTVEELLSRPGERVADAWIWRTG